MPHPPLSHMWYSQLNCIYHHWYKDGLLQLLAVWCRGKIALLSTACAKQIVSIVNNIGTRNHHFVNMLWSSLTASIKKVASLCYTWLRLEQLSYLHESLHLFTPSRSLLSSGQNLLAKTQSWTKTAIHRFSSLAAAVSNYLLSDVHDCENVTTFKMHLKTYRFHRNFGSDWPE